MFWSTAPTPEDSKPVKVVIIGGSYAGHKAAKAAWAHKGRLGSGVHLTMVEPSSHSYFNVAGPRLLVEPSLMDKTFFSNAEILHEETDGKGVLIAGRASAVDLDSKVVTIDDAESTKVDYDILIIATGTQVQFPGFGVNGDHSKTKAALESVLEKLKSASSVAVVGGGPTGVESAGEFASDLNAAVTLYTGPSGPLSRIDGGRLVAPATQQLEALGATVNTDGFVDRVEYDEDGLLGTVHVGLLSTHYDVVLECYNLKPNSDFLPASIKDKRGFVATDADLVAAPGVLAYGDIVALSAQALVDLEFGQSKRLAKSLQSLIEAVRTGAELAPKANTTYTAVVNTIMVPISRAGGVAILFGWWMPNFVVWLLKSRTFMIPGARKLF